MKKHTSRALTDSELDELLYTNDSVSPPEDFTQQVMQSIRALPQTKQKQPICGYVSCIARFRAAL